MLCTQIAASVPFTFSTPAETNSAFIHICYVHWGNWNINYLTSISSQVEVVELLLLGADVKLLNVTVWIEPFRESLCLSSIGYCHTPCYIIADPLKHIGGSVEGAVWQKSWNSICFGWMTGGRLENHINCQPFYRHAHSGGTLCTFPHTFAYAVFGWVCTHACLWVLSSTCLSDSEEEKMNL